MTKKEKIRKKRKKVLTIETIGVILSKLSTRTARHNQKTFEKNKKVLDKRGARVVK